MISNSKMMLINNRDYLCHNNNKEYYKKIKFKTDLRILRKL